MSFWIAVGMGLVVTAGLAALAILLWRRVRAARKALYQAEVRLAAAGHILAQWTTRPDAPLRSAALLVDARQWLQESDRALSGPVGLARRVRRGGQRERTE
jgi:hypothetical protein